MYSVKIGQSQPGMFIILVDQSYSMSDPFEGTGMKKSDFAAYAVNRVIDEIIEVCTDGPVVKDRCNVAVITYGGTTNNAEVDFIEKVSELSKNQNTAKIKRKKIINNQEVEITEDLRVFVKPQAAGGTPMADAFRKAGEAASAFAARYPGSFPPIVINITDGEPTDNNGPTFDDARKAAKELVQIGTSDGNLILMNVHVPDAASRFLGRIDFPSSSFSIQDNNLAKFLFEISSVLPNEFINKASVLGISATKDSRAFVFNSDADTLVKFLNFGSGVMLR